MSLDAYERLAWHDLERRLDVRTAERRPAPFVVRLAVWAAVAALCGAKFALALWLYDLGAGFAVLATAVVLLPVALSVWWCTTGRNVSFAPTRGLPRAPTSRACPSRRL